MITKTALRSCVSPAVAFTFAVVSVTGVLMLFDIDRVEDLHKWMGLAFAFVGIMHLACNWRALVVYFHGRKIVVWGAAMLLICAVLLLGIGDNDRDIDDGPKSEAMEHVKNLHDE
jgi:Na+/melibiose symporter-like transporter